MKMKLNVLLSALTATVALGWVQASDINYDNVIILDAESLAETGIKEAYVKLIPELRKYVPHPVEVVEIFDQYLGRYEVKSGGVSYLISDPKIDEYDSWGLATYAFFSIVNRQLVQSKYRFYAINSGNDLAGLFLTESQYNSAQRSIKKKTDRPYVQIKNIHGLVRRTRYFVLSVDSTYR